MSHLNYSVMTKEIIEELLLKVKSVCPSYVEVSVKELSLGKTSVLYLFIIKYNKEFADADEWVINEVYKLIFTVWHIAENDKLKDKVRFLFYHKNNFVVHTPVNISVIRQFDDLIRIENRGYDYCTHCIGRVFDINQLIDYLIKQHENF